ncbi:MAG: glutamine synthetase family protein [Alphaproteobacteria bacterium]
MIREELVMACTCDISGQVRGKGFPISEIDSRLVNGVGWTPTNHMITAFGPIADSPWGPFGDLILRPDADTEVRVDFQDGSAIEHFLLCDLFNTDGSPWDCCPRRFLRAAVDDMRTEMGLHVLSAFEHEFYYFGAQERIGSAYTMDAIRRHGIFAEVYLAALRAAGIACDSYLSEYGPRQYEVTCDPTRGVRSADQAIIVREIARATAQRLGSRVSFAPAVTPDVVGNGVHIHLSLLDSKGIPVAYDAAAPYGLSRVGGSFVAGILRHSRALCALTVPGVVSYLRLVPHRWSAAWNNLGFRDREAMVRICPVNEIGGRDPARQFNVEFRAADATANPYLALGAIIRAGLVGLRQELPMPEITTHDPETLADSERERLGIARLPQSLDEALEALAADEVVRAWFPEQFLDAYLRHKNAEIAIMRDLDRDTQCARYTEAY